MRLVRQMVTESLLLATLGGAAGLTLGYIARNVIPHLLATRNVQQMPIAFDWQVLAFTAAVSLLTGLVFGAFPAWQATRTTLGTALKDASQGTRRKLTTGKLLVVTQIALSAVLLIGAGLFVRTLSNLMHTTLGFQADHLLLFHIKPPRTRYTGPQTIALYTRMEERLQAIPGVTSMSVSSIALIGDGHSGSTFHVSGRPVAKEGRIQMNTVGNAYFATLAMPIVRGRAFDTTDTGTSPKVAVINQALAKKYFPTEDPIGQMFDAEDVPVPIRIVGVSADTSYANLREKTPPLFFLLYNQYPDVGSMAVMVRTHIDPLTMAEPIRQAIAALDPNLPVVDLRTMEDQIDTSLTSERTFARLTTGFGVIALLLAMVGIYGIMAYTVARRTNEIGLRMALGAKTSEVTTMILGEAGWLAVCGITLGTLGAVALVRSVETMLFGLKPFDPLTLLATAVLLGLITLIAAFGPAYRAAHIDPLRALRHE
jgi:predicted permease